ncbi:MAG TPA: hypothetical protein VFG68_16205 [Fimbriiglobus sp.]|nr:hypothetical protein [Fimbriiglobus sp.]
MRNLLALIGAAVVLFAGLGWYLGWYTFALGPSAGGKQRLQLDVDTGKLTDDVERFGKSIGSAVQRAKDDPAKAQPADFVGPPLPPDMKDRHTTGRPTLPTQR